MGKRGRPRKTPITETAEPPAPEIKRKRGRPRKIPVSVTAGPIAEQATAAPPVPPVIREEVYEGTRGHVRMYIREGEKPEPPAEPPKAPKTSIQADYTPSVEITVTSDAEQRRLIDEYGELDRRMQLRQMDYARYESLKRAIKSWFDQAPADADGTVEGDVYLLHLSARERERRIRNMRDVMDLIGIEKLLDLAVVPIGKLENLLGVAHVATLTIDARTGSRRIKAIAKRAVEAV
jgi:hypothetical protein